MIFTNFIACVQSKCQSFCFEDKKLTIPITSSAGFKPGKLLKPKFYFDNKKLNILLTSSAGFKPGKIEHSNDFIGRIQTWKTVKTQILF